MNDRLDKVCDSACRILTLLILIGHLVGCAVSQDAERGENSLARFTDGELVLDGRVDFPDAAGDLTEVLHCQSSISEQGRASNTLCFGSEATNQNVKKSVYKAVEDSEMWPAIFEGKAVPVLLHFRVLLARRGAEESIRLYENWGHDAERLGWNYRAPQQYGGNWNLSKCRDFSKKGRFMMQATVLIAEDGTPSGEPKVAYADGSLIRRGCAESLGRMLQAGDYIPGELSDSSVEATYATLYGHMSDFSAVEML